MTSAQETMDTHSTDSPTAATSTPYARSLKSVQGRAKLLPAGWGPAFKNTLRRLQGMDCEQRADLLVSGPWVSNGQITFSLSRADRCVGGLVRRTAAQLQACCELCGRSGRMRVLGIQSRVLCPECYAPQALEEDVNRLLDDRRVPHPVVFEADLAERARAFVQPGTWREHRDARGHAVRYLLLEDLRDWPSRLVSAKDLPAVPRGGGTAW